MAALMDILPPAKSSRTSQYNHHSNDPWFKQSYVAAMAKRSMAITTNKPVPPYLKRDEFRPNKPEDFGDGGAFPEIPYSQCPLGMGRKSDANARPGRKTLPVTVDVPFSASKIVYSQHRDLVPKILKKEEAEEEGGDSDELRKETTMKTKAALEKIGNLRLNVPPTSHSSDSKYIKYKLSQQWAASSSGAKERIIRVADTPVDPLEPPKFKHKRIPKAASGSPPPPLMHSPPRPVTVKDQQDWKVPPCISNWKNPKGYTIPLEKRLAADGRGLEEVPINDNFGYLSESLYVAEQKAREAVAMRSRVEKELALKEKERKEYELRALAQTARSEKMFAAGPTASIPMMEEQAQRLQREKIREERRRERRLESRDAAMGKKSKITRDVDRDISERVAVGMACTSAGIDYDQRLMNQETGLGSGFATEDDLYTVYDKRLFTAHPTLSTLFRPKKEVDGEMYGGADEQQMEKILKNGHFKPSKAFGGTSQSSGPRDRPVEFEKKVDEIGKAKEAEEDHFGLDKLWTEMSSSMRGRQL